MTDLNLKEAVAALEKLVDYRIFDGEMMKVRDHLIEEQRRYLWENPPEKEKSFEERMAESRLGSAFRFRAQKGACNLSDAAKEYIKAGDLYLGIGMSQKANEAFLNACVMYLYRESRWENVQGQEVEMKRYREILSRLDLSKVEKVEIPLRIEERYSKLVKKKADLKLVDEMPEFVRLQQLKNESEWKKLKENYNHLCQEKDNFISGRKNKQKLMELNSFFKEVGINSVSEHIEKVLLSDKPFDLNDHWNAHELSYSRVG